MRKKRLSRRYRRRRGKKYSANPFNSYLKNPMQVIKFAAGDGTFSSNTVGTPKFLYISRRIPKYWVSTGAGDAVS